MESIVRTISEKKLINTGFLHGPFCPIYGIGAIILFAFLDKFENNLILLFFVAIIVLTIWEYIVGWMLEKLFNTKYWDYSEQKFNIQGRVCLTNSICWGILGVLLVKYIHPFIKSKKYKINTTKSRKIKQRDKRKIKRNKRNEKRYRSFKIYREYTKTSK